MLKRFSFEDECFQGGDDVRTQKIQAEQNKNTAGNLCSEGKTGGQDGPSRSKRPVKPPV